MVKDDYDIEQIKADYNDRLGMIKYAIETDDCENFERLLVEPLYDDVDELPKKKRRYQVTLKRVLTYTCEVEAEDEDDAILQAEEEHIARNCNMNEWDFDEDLESEVEPVEED